MKTEKSQVQLFRGQTVTIEYGQEFKKEYPHTFEIFNGKTGLITAFVDETLVAIKLPFLKIETLVDRSHVKT